MILVIARYTLKKGTRTQYLAEIKKAEIIEKCRAEKGNISYEFLNSNDNPNEIVVLERWENQKVLDIHGTLPHFAEMLEIKKQFNPTPTVIDKFDV